MTAESPEGATQAGTENPYDSPRECDGDGSSYGQLKKQKRWRRFLFGFSLAWIAFILVTGTYADNLRYMQSNPRFLAYIALIGIGNIACLVCLVMAVRGWWHILMAPIWFLCLLELLILAMHTAEAVGLIQIPPWSERSRQHGAALYAFDVELVSPLRG